MPLLLSRKFSEVNCSRFLIRFSCNCCNVRQLLEQPTAFFGDKIIICQFLLYAFGIESFSIEDFDVFVKQAGYVEFSQVGAVKCQVGNVGEAEVKQVGKNTRFEDA